jgi:hypothetical protein
MKITTREYIDNQVNWIKELEKKDMEWMEKHVDSEVKAVREAVSIDKANMDAWKSGHNEWKTRMEQLTSQTVTRREAWILVLAVVSFIITLWVKK